MGSFGISPIHKTQKKKKTVSPNLKCVFPKHFHIKLKDKLMVWNNISHYKKPIKVSELGTL